MTTTAEPSKNKKNSSNSLQNVAYCVISFNGRIYFHMKKGKAQLFGKKIKPSFSTEEIIAGLISSIYEKTGKTFSPDDFHAASCKPFHDTKDKNQNVSQKCFVFRLELEKPLNLEKVKDVFFVTKEDVLNKTSGFKMMAISENIINYLR